jgi:transposase
MLELLPPNEYVNADETSIRVQERGKTRRAYIWTFIAEQMVVYKYSPDRSGETPKEVLGDSTGTLQVDGYSGYNYVTTPERRTRAGCLAHARRYFYNAMKTAPEEARYGLDRILDLYEVEYDAAEQNILGTDRHLAIRRVKSSRIMKKWHQWLEEQKPFHPPKSPISKAIKYTLNNWEALTLFLGDAKIRLDNNLSEQQLRIIALGRKNYLFIGHDLAGQNLAILQSLINTCEFNGVNPQDYLADVLMRTQIHPNSGIDELLPWNWKPPDREEAKLDLSGSDTQKVQTM